MNCVVKVSNQTYLEVNDDMHYVIMKEFKRL